MFRLKTLLINPKLQLKRLKAITLEDIERCTTCNAYTLLEKYVKPIQHHMPASTTNQTSKKEKTCALT